MTELAVSDLSEDEFLATVANVCAAEPSLTQIGAALLVAVHLGIAKDSRTFSRIFGVSHALVLRDVTSLSGDEGYLHVASRNARTQRTELALTEKALGIVSRFCESPAG